MIITEENALEFLRKSWMHNRLMHHTKKISAHLEGMILCQIQRHMRRVDNKLRSKLPGG